MSIELTTISDADRRGIVSALAADPTPVASDTDKRLLDAAIGEVVSIYGEASRIERFVGNLADPSKFFIAGFAPIDVVLIEEDPATSITLGGFWEQTEPDMFVNDDTGLSAERDDAESPWRLMSEASAFTLFTASTVTATPQEVVAWIPNPAYTELDEIEPPTITAWDNSGVVVNDDPGTPYAPAGVYGGRMAYYDGYGVYLFYAPEDGWGFSETLGGVLDEGFEVSDAVYPWLIEEPSLIYTRAPAANNDNWVVLKNTINLLIENGLENSVFVNGVEFAQYSGPTSVGWVDPLRVPVDLDGQSISSMTIYQIPTENSMSITGSIATGLLQEVQIPVVAPLRGSLWLYFAS